MVSTNVNTAQLKELAEQWLSEHAEQPFTLVIRNHQLELQKTDEPKLGAICVNFVSGT
ncbi:Protein of unknown function (DUF548), partial [Gilliamella apicola SCGC AB-598-I20]